MIKVFALKSLTDLSELARERPRKRRSKNLPDCSAALEQRLFTGIERRSYIRPQHHAGTAEESFLIGNRGKVTLILFDVSGEITEINECRLANLCEDLAVG